MSGQPFQGPVHGRNVLAGISVSGKGVLNFNDRSNESTQDRHDADLRPGDTHFGNIRNSIHDVHTHDQSRVYVGNNTIHTEVHNYSEPGDSRCLTALFIADPEDDKAHIKKTKGGLLEDSYRWILDHDDFKRFRNDPESRLLWIKGGPGKGKTMLLCGILDELEKESSVQVSYFFCQATQDHRNDVTSVLRGLIWLLCKGQPSMVSYVLEDYDVKGDKLFEGAHPWVSLAEILTKMLNDSRLSHAVLAVDALDECRDEYRDDLIELITNCSRNTRSKWIVCSRDWPDISAKLELADFEASQKITVQLELNQDSISEAVNKFIHFKVARLARMRKYKPENKTKVVKALLNKADNTFLWVALVCEELEKIKSPHIDKTLASIPSGLDKLYQRMLDQILKGGDAEACNEILATACIAYRPMRLDELSVLIKDLKDYNDEELIDLVGECGSFLSLQDGIVYLVHQSAKDFLTQEAVYKKVFPLGIPSQHLVMFRHSLEGLMTLKRDIYCLDYPGVLIEEVSRPDPDPLSHLGYSCVHWIDHLEEAKDKKDLSDDGAMDKFIREKFLYWLEALSLLGKVPDGSMAMQKLMEITDSAVEGGNNLIIDARRFIFFNRKTIKIAPLQVYASALVFSPTGSVIRKLFEREEPGWMTLKPKMETNWDACVQTIDAGGPVTAMAFLPDALRLGSGTDGVVKIWDVASGQCIRSMEASSHVETMAFSTSGQLLAVGLADGTIGAWDAKTGLYEQRLWDGDLDHDPPVLFRGLMGHDVPVNEVTFSSVGDVLASASYDGVRTWDPVTGKCLQRMGELGNRALTVAFSTDGQQLASGGQGTNVKIWDVITGRCICTLEGHTKEVRSVSFFAAESLASYSRDNEFKIWDLSTGVCVRALNMREQFYRLEFSEDGQKIASAFDKGLRQPTIHVWDAAGATFQTLIGHTDIIRSLTFSADKQALASGGDDCTIKIWDLTSNSAAESIQYHDNEVKKVAFSPDGQWLVSLSWQDIKIWDTTKGTCVHTLNTHPSAEISFSQDSRYLALEELDYDTTSVKIWDLTDGHFITKFHGIAKGKSRFSPDGRLVALCCWNKPSSNRTVQIWDIASQNHMCTLEYDPQVMDFSADSRNLVLVSAQDVQIWDVFKGHCIQTLDRNIFPTQDISYTENGTEDDADDDDAEEDTEDDVDDDAEQHSEDETEGDTEDDVDDDAEEDTEDDDDYAEKRSVYDSVYESRLQSVTLSSDSQWLAANTRRAIFVVDLRAGTLLHTLKIDPKHYIDSISLSLNGKWLASTSSYVGDITLWNMKTGTYHYKIPSRIQGNKVLFDPTSESQLLTSFGLVDLDQGPAVVTSYGYTFQEGRVYGHSISAGGDWIMNGNQRVLFVPIGYRAWESTCMGSSVAIGLNTGRMLLMQFK